MDARMLARLGAIAFVAVAITVTVIELSRKDEPSALPSASLHQPYRDPLREGQRRCQPVSYTHLSSLGGSGLVYREYDPLERTLIDVDVPGQRQGLWPFTLSSPERAYLEVLMDVPTAISFEHANQLLQGMTTLSPRRMEELLRKCTNVKVRRLFYWMAERNAYAWVKKLPEPRALDALGLGRGNRVLAKGGRLDQKYRITVPEEMWTPPALTTDKSAS